MESGVAENGIFYYGATRRELPKMESTQQPVIGTYDADAPDFINARRYFGFTDYEEVDIFMLRSRKIMRGNGKMATYYYNVLKNHLGLK